MTIKDTPDVKLLDMLERSIERLIQAPVTTLFRQEIQPAEIERRLERAMLDNARRASGANIMPNAYVVELSPEDFAAIETYRTSLVRRLESWLTDRAAAHDGTMLDLVRVEIRESERAGRRQPAVSASITDIAGGHAPPRQPARDAQRTEVYRVAGSVSCAFRLLTGPDAGMTFTIPEGSSTLGRAPDTDMQIAAGDVSRHHLRIDRHGGKVEIVDLDSTNGTRVNGEKVRRATLRNGDEVLVGTQMLRFVES